MAGDTIDVLGSHWTLAGDAEPIPSDPDVSEGRQWSRWDFRDRVEKAAEVGYTGMGIWYSELEHVLESRTLEEMKEILDENGIEDIELEFLNFWFLDEDDERRRDEAGTRALLLEAAEVFDAHHLKVGNIPGTPAEPEVVKASFEELCAEAAESGTKVGYEIIPFDPNVTSIEEALYVVDEPENGGLVLDVWHMEKMGVDYDEIREIPASKIIGAEINDGFWNTGESLEHEVVNMRTLPGEGEFDVRGFVEAVRDTGYDGCWGVEVLSEELRELPMDELYVRAYDSALSVL